ncbi:MAG: DUF1328 family protein [Patescibacteria group bacterium]
MLTLFAAVLGFGKLLGARSEIAKALFWVFAGLCLLSEAAMLVFESRPRKE